jgi:ribosomal protein L37E
LREGVNNGLSNKSIIYCAKCGKQLGNNSKFCTQCGTPINQQNNVNTHSQHNFGTDDFRIKGRITLEDYIKFNKAVFQGKFFKPSEYTCKKIYEENPLYREDETYCINKDTITVLSENAKVRFLKNQIQKIIHDEDSIYIMIGTVQGLVIKARYCKSFDEFNRLRYFLQINYPGNTS